MKISKRLKLIANMITENNIVIDVGCDHALLDIYLTLNNRNTCIASDVSEKVIQNAINNIKKYKVSDKIRVSVSDGTKNIEIPKKTTVVICGMGTPTILNILEDTIHDNIDELIIQSNNDLNSLRKNVCMFGYYIENEKVLLDKNIFYVIIKFKKGYEKYTQKQLELGPILYNKSECKTYYKFLLNKNNDILRKLSLKNFKLILKYRKINNWIKIKTK